MRLKADMRQIMITNPSWRPAMNEGKKETAMFRANQAKIAAEDVACAAEVYALDAMMVELALLASARRDLAKSAKPLTYKESGDIIIRMAGDIQRERKHAAMDCILSA